MIEAHTFDAWTRSADRATAAFRDATILGGFAAPLFLWLAGLSIPLAVSRGMARGHSRAAAAEAVCRRGVEIFILAFLFRVQAFIVSPGSPFVAIFKVDILNVMGPAIAIAALIAAMPLSPSRLALVYGVAATVVAMTTPIVRLAGAIDSLPVWLQWYARPAGDQTTFTAFPWIGFVFAGASAGVLVERSVASRRESLILAGIGIAGVAVLALGALTSTRPTIYTQSSYWTTSPTYFAVRTGIMMLALWALFALERALVRSRLVVHELFMTRLRPLATLGRHSLFIYWIHVELVYGYASWAWRGRLPIWATVIAYAPFVVLMYGTIPLKERVEAWWRRRRERAAPQPVAA